MRRAEPALAAFRRHILESGGLLAQVEAGDAQALERLRTVSRLIAASPARLDMVTRWRGGLVGVVSRRTWNTERWNRSQPQPSQAQLLSSLLRERDGRRDRVALRTSRAVA